MRTTTHKNRETSSARDVEEVESVYGIGEKANVPSPVSYVITKETDVFTVGMEKGDIRRNEPEVQRLTLERESFELDKRKRMLDREERETDCRN